MFFSQLPRLLWFPDRHQRPGRHVLSAGLALLPLSLVLAACGAAAPLPPGDHPRLTSISMLSPTEGWAAGEGGALLHFAGGRWTRVSDPTGADLNGIAMAAPGEGWAVGLDPAAGKGIILRAQKGMWAVDVGIATPALRAVALVSAVEGWAVGDGGTILHLTGTHWTRVVSPTTADLMAVTMVSPVEAWATGYDLANTPSGGVYTGVILHLRDGRWRQASTAGNARLYGVAATERDSWLVGASAQSAATILYGVRGIWTPAGGDIRQALSAIMLVSATEGWAVGYHGALVHEVDGSWTPLRSPTNNDLFGIAMLSPTEGWAVGDQNTILHDDKGVWRVYHV